MKGDLTIMKNIWETDIKNDRLVAYLPNLTYTDVHKLKEDINQHQRGKWIIYSIDAKAEELIQLGFSLEAATSGFFNGEKAYIYTRYGREDRSCTKTKEGNEKVLRLVSNDKKEVNLQNESPYPTGKVTEEELISLVQLYKLVFPQYPTNIFEPKALKKAMENDYLFVVAKDGEEVIAAASAMRTGYGSAEITDCAVNPDYRGKQLLHYLVVALEKECIAEGIDHVFSITRARSTGMNMTVKRLNYEYEGTLINNCIITSGFEDMNIWSKALKK